MTQGIAAIVAIGIFPAMLRHVLSGYRGKESFDNLLYNSLNDSWKNYEYFFNMINTELFGGIAVYIFFVLLLLLVIMPFINRNVFKELISTKKILIIRYLCIIVPTTFYFGLVAKIAVFTSDRYMFPIYAVLFAVVLSGVSECFHILEIRQWILGLIILVVIINVNSWENMEWQYLYRQSEDFIENASNYSDVDCLYVYKKSWTINYAYYEVSKYHSVTFIRKDELDLLGSWEVAKKNHLIVVIEDDEGDILERVIGACRDLNVYDYLGGYGYTNTYYLQGWH